MRYDYSRQRLGAMTLRLLANLAARARPAGVARGAARRQAGQHQREARRLAHRVARRPVLPPRCSGRLQRMKALVVNDPNAKRSYKSIVNLGTGGSDLGPRLLADALGDGNARRALRGQRRPAATSSARSRAPSPATTLFVVVSKTFTTQETMANAAAAKALGRQGTSTRSPPMCDSRKQLRRH